MRYIGCADVAADKNVNVDCSVIAGMSVSVYAGVNIVLCTDAGLFRPGRKFVGGYWKGRETFMIIGRSANVSLTENDWGEKEVLVRKKN